ncbi:tyrosine-type recombinase/integrase [Micromonospora aurantiaca (nom. illeg.)]|uniref:tyrosine-type recombinase/integrase n=1 Tax=Micromonospora aurantiaca (nom. illeg.) TaxID=47850 RepID=UPI0011A93BAE|nr:tyrosine-type recombinase/integrase [Micromonospora aurantiaca]MBC9006410.1 tyrosine-type recombinase/integrase [Micromonospora aurantiaca]
MTDPYIAEYLQDLRANGKHADSTLSTYADLLNRLDRQLPEGLTGAHADELRAAIYTEGRKPGTRHLYRAAVTGFFRWACDPDEPRLDWDPSRYLPSVRIPQRASRPITHDQLRDILARARAPFRVWYLLAAGEGLRCVEISRLDREDITEADTLIRGKGGRERIVPTPAALWQAVVDLPSGPIARHPDGTGRADRRQVRERANYHLQRTLRHRGVSMHRLRHWYGTYVHKAGGGDLRVTQELLGHASPNTTQVYVDTSGDSKRAAVDNLPLPVD